MGPVCGLKAPETAPDAEGGFQIEGLPESTWTLRAWCRSADDVVWQAEGKAQAGGSIDLRLVPQPAEAAK